MNERFKQLAEQAGYRPLSPPSFADELNEIFMQKFAVLLVRECAQFVEDKYDFLGEEIIVKEEMLEHFGVKE